jgi:hypothetical protein
MGRPTENPRGERLGFRVSEEESEMIKYCMEYSGMSKSDILRLGIRKVYEEVKTSNQKE